MTNSLTLRNPYQWGYVVRDLDEAVEHFRSRFGVEKFRISRHSPDVQTAHAYVGDAMLELVQVSPNGPPQFVDHVPAAPQVAQFHHNAYRIADQESWDALTEAVKASGFTYYEGKSKARGIETLFVDMRQEIGVHAEYVYLSGDGLTYYDTVPRNDPA